MFYSQFGEDKILNELFNDKAVGICVEVGANNGIDGSTTYFFEKKGWQCILVEPNPLLCLEMRRTRSARIVECAASDRTGTAVLDIIEGSERSDGLSTISPDRDYKERIKKLGFNSRQVSVSTRTLDDIFSESRVLDRVDFVSIDVEGHELEVLRGFSIDKWRPGILLVEDNSHFEDSVVSDFLKSKYGYVRFNRTGVNDWYAHHTDRRFVRLKSVLTMAWLKFFSIARRRLKAIPVVDSIIQLVRGLGAGCK